MHSLDPTLLRRMSGMDGRRAVPNAGTTAYNGGFDWRADSPWVGENTDQCDRGSDQGKKAGSTDIDDLFLKVLSIRWLLIDEISVLAALVFGILNNYLQRACNRQPYAKRSDGSKRPFGGLNLITSGDGWQLSPV